MGIYKINLPKRINKSILFLKYSDIAVYYNAVTARVMLSKRGQQSDVKKEQENAGTLCNISEQIDLVKREHWSVYESIESVYLKYCFFELMTKRIKITK